eukprot:2522543-Rhodomonas_salina.1
MQRCWVVPPIVRRVSSYAPTTCCPVLTSPMLLPGKTAQASTYGYHPRYRPMRPLWNVRYCRSVQCWTQLRDALYCLLHLILYHTSWSLPDAWY